MKTTRIFAQSTQTKKAHESFSIFKGSLLTQIDVQSSLFEMLKLIHYTLFLVRNMYAII